MAEQMGEVLIELVPLTQKAVFARYFQLYLQEHAMFTGKNPVDGIFRYPWFDLYWQEPGKRWAFWMRTAEDVAAIALVRIDDEDGRYEMAEFFVVDQYRGEGLGDMFAKDIILRFKGRWKLNQVKGNERAVAFWRRVLGDIVPYETVPLICDDGVERVEQCFTI